MSSEIHVPSHNYEVPAKPLMTFNQREEDTNEIDNMRSMLPNLKSAQDRGAVAQRIKRLETSMNAQSPRTDLSGETKNRLYKEAQALQAKITEGMLTKEEMRKNDAGSVGHHMRWEKANKRKILKWKNIMRTLDPTSNDPDLSNFERFRPTGVTGRLRVDAQIPGVMAYGNVSQEQWDQAFEGKGPENTALKQAERVAKSKKWTPERKEAARQAYQARMAKKSEGL